MTFTYDPDFVIAHPQLRMIAQLSQQGIFDTLMSELDWERRSDAPRYEYWTNTLGRPYTYGRGAGQRTYESKPEHVAIKRVSRMLESRLGFQYEGCFLNRYDDARDHLGWHSDDDAGIDHRRPIAVVTLGSAREIGLRRIDLIGSGIPAERILLAPGSLFLMHAGMQQTHQHSIPKAGREVGPRISLTFRSLLAP